MNIDRLKKLRENSLIKNLLVYFVSSISALLITVVLQFLLPKIISVEDYGLYKTFTLYLSFTSLLHFGLKDGIYMKISEQEVLNIGENKIYFTSMLIQQALVFLLMFSIGFVVQGIMQVFFFALAAASFFFIMNTYYDSLFQSRKEFKVVSFLKIFKEGTLLFLVAAAYFLFNEISLDKLLGYYVASIFLTFLIYTYKARPMIGIKIPSKSDLKTVIAPVYKRGVGLLAGNFGNQINANADKLFVSTFFSVKAFAYYSFGGLFFVLTNTLVGSMSTVLLPYLLTDYKEKLQSTYGKLLKITNLFALVLFFYVLLVGWIVFSFYKDYITSIPIISLFFGAMVYNMKINIVQNNYLKTLRLDRAYIMNGYFVLTAFLIAMFALYAIGADLQYYALSTSVFVFARYMLNQVAINRELSIAAKLSVYDVFIWLLAVGIYFLTKQIYL